VPEQRRGGEQRERIRDVEDLARELAESRAGAAYVHDQFFALVA
jgi:hypothetical protein